MRRRLFHRCGRRLPDCPLLGRRLVVAMSLVAYLITACGIPLPISTASAVNASGPKAYPCQGGSCGCRSAQQCWRSCCCHSPGERMAWAKAHGIRPPAELLVAVAESQPARSCCQQRLAHVANHSAHGKACCTARAVKGSHGASKIASTPKTNHSKPVYGFSALKCQGLAQHWVTSGAVASPPACVAVNQHQAPSGWIATASAPHLLSFDSPPVPPPRLG
jgi:hypothetical protein